MRPLKMQISSKYKKYAETLTGSKNFVICLKDQSSLFNVEDKSKVLHKFQIAKFP